ncbi:MAG: PQQ-dependent sugar dehydrogenase, partial [Desulfobacterales bacterium]|nr:PQQ-dependent sugar dehydrogenase [Desulfobacterales bacterium]
MNRFRHLLICALIGALAAGWPAAAAPYDLGAWLHARVAPADIPFMEPSSGAFRVQIVAEGLESPWAVVPAPDGRIFVTERPGRLRVVQNGTLSATPVAGVPRVAYQGQGGLLDLALHPDYRSNRMVYLC